MSFGIHSSDHLSSLLSMLVVLALNATGVALVMFCWLRARPYAPQRTSRTTVHGVVTGAGGMRIEIDSRGTERQGVSGVRYAWKEHARRITYQRFIVRTTTGESIVVMPSERTELRVPLLVTARDAASCTRTAALDDNAEAWIDGELVEQIGAAGEVAALRDAPTEWVLRATVISTEPLEHAAATQRDRYRRWRNYFIVTTLVMQCCFAMYYLQALAGRQTEFDVTSRWAFQCASQRHKYTSFASPQCFALVLDRWYQVNVSEELYAASPETTALPVLSVRFEGFRLVQLGAHATLNSFAACLAVLLMLALVARFAQSLRVARPWYLRQRLRESGSGKLVYSQL